MLKTAKPPNVVVRIRPSTWAAWCALQVTTLAYRHLSGAGVSVRVGLLSLAKPKKVEKHTKNHKKILTTAQQTPGGHFY